MTDAPIPFGYKMGWMAIRSGEPKVVAASLGQPRAVGWAEGVHSIYDREGAHQLLVTPSLNGWVLVAGQWVLAGEESGELAPLLTKLSVQFGEAQAFGTHRVVEYHFWMKAHAGQVDRAFAYLGEQGIVRLNQGEPTAVERSLPSFSSDPDEWMPDEADVIAVAAAWSVDPSSLDSEVTSEGSPLLVTVPHN